MRLKVSIIIPAYNEERRIGNTLEEYCKFFRELQEKRILEFEILVVLNACKDNTLGVVKEYQKKFSEIKVLDFEKGGKGFAIIQGFKDALTRDNDLIGFIDADMATPPESFSELIRNCKNYDGIIASRWRKDSFIKTKQTILRKITSKGFNFLTRSILFLRFNDTQCGAKLFKRATLEKVIDGLGITQWAFDIDLLCRLKSRGLKVIEIPTIWEDKKESKLELVKVPLQMFASIIRLRLIYSPFDFIVKMYDKIPKKKK